MRRDRKDRKERYKERTGNDEYTSVFGGFLMIPGLDAALST